MTMTDRTITRASGLVERLCEHGVGHPERESAEALARVYGQDVSAWMVHGCDGCCMEDSNE